VSPFEVFVYSFVLKTCLSFSGFALITRKSMGIRKYMARGQENDEMY
jgi:hypothetical protein